MHELIGLALIMHWPCGTVFGRLALGDFNDSVAETTWLALGNGYHVVENGRFGRIFSSHLKQSEISE